MLRGAPQACKVRTGARTTAEGRPSSSEIGQSSASSGTWSTQLGAKKKPSKASSVLKEDHLLAMMDSLMTGTGLTSDLNTPDIKFEDFDFKGKAINNYSGSNMEVGSSLAAFEAAGNGACSNDEESLSGEPHTSTDSYSLFDMSPGSRDVLQADQHEQRINIQDYMKGEDDTYTSCISSIPISELNYGLAPIQTAPETLAVTGLGATALAQPAQMMDLLQPCNSPPQISIGDDDFNFSIPQDMLEQMESLFPEEPIISNPVPANNVSSTELDMYLGTHDLVSESMEMSGLLDHELEAFDFEDSDLSTVDAGAIRLPCDVFNAQDPKAIAQPLNLLPNTIIQPVKSLPNAFVQPVNAFPKAIVQTINPLPKAIVQTVNPLPKAIVQNVNPLPKAIVQPVNPLPGFSTSVLTEPITFSCPDPSMLVTPTPSTTCAYPKTPSKKRPCIEDVTPTTSAGKRQRRAAKKPLRFREPETFVELVGSESNDSTVAERLGFEDALDSVDVRVDEIKDEEEDPDIASRGGKKSVQNLTEEQKYHRIRVLNNEASKRCRQKRKMTMKEMASEVVVLEEKNHKLKNKHQDLEKLRDRFQSFVNDYFRKRLASSQ